MALRKQQTIAKHNWKLVSGGMYDSLYQCTKCGLKNMESVDNGATDNPIEGCIEGDPPKALDLTSDGML
jgi:hypothetical protein